MGVELRREGAGGGAVEAVLIGARIEICFGLFCGGVVEELGAGARSEIGSGTILFFLGLAEDSFLRL